MVKRISSAAARQDFATIVQSTVAGNRVKLTRYNKTIAIIIPTSDLAALEDCEQRRTAGRMRRPRKTKGR